MFQVKISTPKKHFRSPSFAVEKLKIEFSIIAESGFGQFFEWQLKKLSTRKRAKEAKSLLANSFKCLNEAGVALLRVLMSHYQ